MRKCAAAAALLVLCLASAASAAPIAITVGGGWETFCWNPDGTPAYSDVVGCPLPAPRAADQWVFDSLEPTILRVTDCCTAGDFFEVFDFGVLLGRSVLGPNPLLDGDWMSGEYAKATLSHLTVMLGPGNHEIGIVNVEGCCGSGLGGIRVDSVVPEPATLTLLGSALLGIKLARRRRR